MDKPVWVKVNPNFPEPEKIRLATNTLMEDGLVVYPTETVYGLGANAISEKAVKKVFEVKRRDPGEPVSVAVSSLEMAKKIANVTKDAEKIFRWLLPGPLTLVLQAKLGLPKLLMGGREKIGIRMPNSKVALELVRMAGVPLTSTSANLSGGLEPSTAEEAVRQLGKRVDLILDAGRCPISLPSTVLDLTEDPPLILRKGPVSYKEVMAVLRAKGKTRTV